MQIDIIVQSKIARPLDPKCYIVCGNSDYIINFSFDEEWEEHDAKTARFAFGGKYIDVVFTGNQCPAPILSDTVAVGIGVFAGNLRTTTPALVNCRKSALCDGGAPAAPAPDVYAQIMELINKAIGGENEMPDMSDYYTKAETDERIGQVESEVAFLGAVITQSGLIYTADTETAYTERVTADGANVLDESTAVLKKVVGNTVACKNLVDIEKIDASMGDSAVTLEVNFTQNIFVSAGELATVSTSIWRFSCTRKDGTIDYVTDGNLANGGKKVTATADNPIVKIVYRGTNITAGQYSKIMIAYGDTAVPYQPYFTGLKSASFAGIESKNADGTESSTLDFPKTPTPLGTTIDFEQKKITDYGVEIVFKGDGTDGISYYQYGASENRRNGIRLRLKIVENFAKGICTDGIVAESASQLGSTAEIAIGYNNSTDLFWVGFLDKIGITTKGQAPTDTNAVMQQVQAYLAQRYADGNPVTIRYVSSTLQSETDFTADNEYTAYKGGTEKVLGNEGLEMDFNNGAKYGAHNTITQNYIVVKE